MMGPAATTIQVVLQLLPDNSSEVIPPSFIGYYVADDGTGDGLSPENPMSYADFLLAVLLATDSVFFKRDDEF